MRITCLSSRVAIAACGGVAPDAESSGNAHTPRGVCAYASSTSLVERPLQRQRGGRRAPCEAALLLVDLGQRQAQSPKCLWGRDQQVAGLPQVLKVFEKETILAIVSRGPL